MHSEGDSNRNTKGTNYEQLEACWRYNSAWDDESRHGQRESRSLYKCCTTQIPWMILSISNIIMWVLNGTKVGVWAIPHSSGQFRLSHFSYVFWRRHLNICGPFYLLSMPMEKNIPYSQTGCKCVTCRELTSPWLGAIKFTNTGDATRWWWSSHA